MRRLIFSTCAVFAVLFFNACERNLDNTDSNNSDDNNSVYTEDESVYDWDSLNVTLIALYGDEVEIYGAGAEYSNSQVVIDSGGTYQLYGELTNGQIYVKASDDQIVQLVFDDVDIKYNSGPAVYVEDAERAIIILNDSSENYLADGASYSNEELNGTIYSKSDLALSGEGTLKVTGNYKDGIVSKDGLVFSSGTYLINTEDDGIRGKDYLVIKYGSYTINSGGDAIKSDNEEYGFGYIEINTGEFNIASYSDGISAFGNLLIHDGAFDIHCSASQSSAKALKAGDLLQIEYGIFTLQTVDDAVHSDYDISINEGEFTIDTDDDGIHAEHDLVIENATITITSSLEGIEGGYITVNNGTITIAARDDGFNATQGHEVMSDDGSQLIVNGGNITVNMSGNDVDAMDSNGDITINGGTVYLNLPTAGMSEALDANGTVKVDSDATVYENGRIYTGSNDIRH